MYPTPLAANLSVPQLQGPPSIGDVARSIGPDGLLRADLIDAAVARVAGVLPATPVVRSERLGAWLKLENLQVTGAYKVRGALNALAAQVARGDRRPVVAASAGNHGLGVAWAARHLGLAATIVVPDDAPATKVRGCRALGARVVQVGRGFEDCLAHAQLLARAHDARLLHAFDDPEVIAGQATVAAEILHLDPDVVVVPVGGGGLAAGVASLLRRRGIRVVGAQVTGVDGLRRALRGDGPLAAPPPATLADGLRVKAPGVLALHIASRSLDDVVLVSEDELAATVRELVHAERIVVEGAAAVAAAALARVSGRRRVAVMTGGNIDAPVLAALLARTA